MDCAPGSLSTLPTWSLKKNDAAYRQELWRLSLGVLVGDEQKTALVEHYGVMGCFMDAPFGV